MVGVTILRRFVAKSLNISVKEADMRLRMGFCLKQGKGHLNFENCFYSIHLIFFPQHSIVFFFLRKYQDKHTISFSLLYKSKLFLLTILIANHQLSYSIDWCLCHCHSIPKISIAKGFIECFCLQQHLMA